MYQFIHANTYALRISTKIRKNGPQPVKRSVASIIGEAMRKEGYCAHVVNPQEPKILFGSMDDLEQRCADYAANTKDAMGRKIRADGHVLIAGIISAPPDFSAQAWADLKADSLVHLREKYGDRLVCALEHEDEPFMQDEHKNKLHNHFHFYVVPHDGEPMSDIHEGLGAIRECEALLKKNGLDRKKHAYEVAESFKVGMSGFQDEFFEKVGAKNGLLRYGPKKRRLTRKEYKAELNSVENIKTAHKESSAILKNAKEKQNELAEMESSLDLRASHLSKKEAATREKQLKLDNKIDLIEREINAKTEFNEKRELKLDSIKTELEKIQETIETQISQIKTPDLIDAIAKIDKLEKIKPRQLLKEKKLIRDVSVKTGVFTSKHGQVVLVKDAAAAVELAYQHGFNQAKTFLMTQLSAAMALISSLKRVQKAMQDIKTQLQEQFKNPSPAPAPTPAAGLGFRAQIAAAAAARAAAGAEEPLPPAGQSENPVRGLGKGGVEVAPVAEVEEEPNDDFGMQFF